MVDVVIDADMRAQVFKISKQLGALSDQAPKVLARAVNDTAKDARKQLANKAQETYDVRRVRFNKALKVKSATVSHPIATLKSTGKPMEIYDFKVVSTGNGLVGHVLKKSPLKPLEGNGLKAFMATYTNDKKDKKTGEVVGHSYHKTVAQRKGKSRYPIKTFMSPSEPQMLGSEEFVWAVVKPDINDELAKNIEREIAKLLAKKA